MKNNTTIVCTCAKYQHLDLNEVKNLVASLQKNGEELLITTDLCAMANENRTELQALNIKTIIACSKRTQNALLKYAGANCQNLYDLRSNNAEFISQELGINLVTNSDITLPAYDESRHTAWYPVIDFSKCIGCMSCVDFCIFGVYEKDSSNMPKVINPYNCKTNCPACARVCPEGAIIFPKHKDAPINGGAVKVIEKSNDSKKIIDDKLYGKLAARRAKKREEKLFKD